jgi:hypothetical protein
LHHPEKEESMQKTKAKRKAAEMLDEYDFSSGVRGKYASRYRQGTNVVVLDPDVARIFPTAKSVNKALRQLAKKNGS